MCLSQNKMLYYKVNKMLTGLTENYQICNLNLEYNYIDFIYMYSTLVMIL